MYSILLAWPDTVELSSFQSETLEYSAALVRLNRLREAECHILAKFLVGTYEYPVAIDALCLLGFIKASHCDWQSLLQIEEQIKRLDLGSWQASFVNLKRLIGVNERAALDCALQSIERSSEEIPDILRLEVIKAYLMNGSLDKASLHLAKYTADHSIEVCSLQGTLLVAQGRYREAYNLLIRCLGYARYSVPLMAQILDVVIRARQANQVVSTAKEALLAHGEHPLFLNNITAVKLLQREPAFARRASMQLQTWSSLGSYGAGWSNQICAYEMCGNTDWIEYIHPAVWSNPLLNVDLASNLVLHLASIQSPRYRDHVLNFVKHLNIQERPFNPAQISGKTSVANSSQSRQLRIAWISGDFTPHPVSRFLHHFFSASDYSRRHHHIFVSLFDHGQSSNLNEFARYHNTEILDLAHCNSSQVFDALRSRQLDIAIDLSGWTGCNCVYAFLQRVAPIQINYLGYFASVGIQTMDYWIGDTELFSYPYAEWHSEKLISLDRPFIAWQPPAFLPEGKIQSVTQPPKGPLAFGTFNHTRKLSDQTLRAWGEILRRTKGSILVLKATTESDSTSKALLLDRFMRCGLDPERVRWVPFTPTSEEHLLQYAQIDISLDPFPNGGCTTTLESLWMGVPVITLKGPHYVSRMSSAILAAAALPELIADSEESYIRLAVEFSHRIEFLRTSRNTWRTSLMESKLGDASDLMRQLEECFDAICLNPKQQ